MYRYIYYSIYKRKNNCGKITAENTGENCRNVAGINPPDKNKNAPAPRAVSTVGRNASVLSCFRASPIPSLMAALRDGAASTSTPQSQRTAHTCILGNVGCKPARRCPESTEDTPRGGTNSGDSNDSRPFTFFSFDKRPPELAGRGGDSGWPPPER